MNDRAARALPALVHTLAALGLASEILYVAVALPRQDDVLTFSLSFVLFTVSLLAVGWILAWKRPGISLSWIVLGMALFTTGAGPACAVGLAVLDTNPPLAEWLLWYGGPSQWAWIPVIGLLLTQLPLRFPDGRLPSPRWRWFSWWTIGALVVSCLVFATISPTLTSADSTVPNLRNPIFLPFWGSATDGGTPVLVALVLLGSSGIGSVASLFIRYRRADALQRTQLRWIFLSFAIVVGGLVLGWIGALLFGSTQGIGLVISDVGEAISGIADSLVPLAILFAVLRTGLYSIDRIVSRTVAYAIVTLSTLAVYGGSLLLVSLLFSGLPAIGVAIATLATAAVFLPLLRWIRRLVDRRFNRTQYDAQTVVERFGQRVRNGADPHTAGADLLSAVGQTLQPSAIGLWTREDVR